MKKFAVIIFAVSLCSQSCVQASGVDIYANFEYSVDEQTLVTNGAIIPIIENYNQIYMLDNNYYYLSEMNSGLVIYDLRNNDIRRVMSEFVWNDTKSNGILVFGSIGTSLRISSVNGRSLNVLSYNLMEDKILIVNEDNLEMECNYAMECEE